MFRVAFSKNILSDKKINLSNKKFDLSNQIEELKACKKNELNKVQSEIPPEIFWENFDCKITKNKYNSSNLEDVPLIHTKLYLTDGTLTNKQTKHTFSITRAFLSSANFTYSGLHFNNEFLFETTDSELTKELKEYFENFYDSLDENLLTKEEIQKELFKYKSELLNKKQE